LVGGTCAAGIVMPGSVIILVDAVQRVVELALVISPPAGCGMLAPIRSTVYGRERLRYKPIILPKKINENPEVDAI